MKRKPKTDTGILKGVPAVRTRSRLLVANELFHSHTAVPEPHHHKPREGLSYLMNWTGERVAAGKSGAGFVFSERTASIVARALIRAVSEGMRVYIGYGNRETGHADEALNIDEKYQGIREGYIAGHLSVKPDPHSLEKSPVKMYHPCLMTRINSPDAECIPTEKIILVVLQSKEAVIYKHKYYRPAFDWTTGRVEAATAPGMFNVLATDYDGNQKVVNTLAGHDQAIRWLRRREKFEIGAVQGKLPQVLCES